MNTIFTTDDPENYTDKINLDELYEKKKLHDLSTTKNYNTILNRIHNRIKTTSRQQLTEQHCWFIVPEMMIGVPKFDQSICIAYIIDKLRKQMDLKLDIHILIYYLFHGNIGFLIMLEQK